MDKISLSVSWQFSNKQVKPDVLAKLRTRAKAKAAAGEICKRTQKVYTEFDCDSIPLGWDWTNVQYTLNELYQHISRGDAFCVAQLKGKHRIGSDFVSSQLIGADLDRGAAIPALLQNDFVARYAGMLYPTSSDSPELHKTRVLFRLDRPISDEKEYKDLVLRVLGKFAEFGAWSDPHCKDSIRLFYGSTKATADNSVITANILPVGVIKDLPLPTNQRPVEWYAQKAIDTARQMIQRSVNGSKHGELLKASRLLGGYVEGGILRESEAITVLETEIEHKADVNDLNSAKATIRDGIKYGRAEPFTLAELEAQRQEYLSQSGNGHTQSVNGTQAPQQAAQPIAKPAKFLLDGGGTDEANAQALIKLYPNKFLNCAQLAKQNQPGWLFYNGKYWQAEQAPESLDRSIVAMLIARCKTAMDEGTDPNTGKFVKEQLVNFCTPNANKIQSCKVNLRSLISTSIGDFDNDKNLLNCQNGVIDLRTGAIIAHNAGQRFTYCVPVDYKPDADSSAWVTWLRDTVGGDLDTVKYLQMAVGYSLTGHTSEECLFYVHGPTRSGKGTFSETILKLLGDPLANGVDFATFTEKRDGDSQNFDLAGLKATRFVVASESNKYQFLNPRRIKAVTGGDAIRCAHKHGPFFSYFPQFKIWLLSNEPVKGDSEDDALWSRVNVISFPHSHLGHEDKALKRKMLEPANLEGVLAWAVAGASEWYASAAGLQKPAKVVSVTQQQRDKNDFSQQFIDDCLTAAPEQFLPNPVWKAVYKSWCEAHNLTPKDGKARAAIGKLYTDDRRYIDLAYLGQTQYSRVITLPPGFNMQQFRGYNNVMITEDTLNEYL